MADDTTLEVGINARVTGQDAVNSMASSLARMQAALAGVGGKAAASAISALGKAEQAVARVGTATQKTTGLQTASAIAFGKQATAAKAAAAQSAAVMQATNRQQAAVTKGFASIKNFSGSYSDLGKNLAASTAATQSNIAAVKSQLAAGGAAYSLGQKQSQSLKAQTRLTQQLSAATKSYNAQNVASKATTAVTNAASSSKYLGSQSQLSSYNYGGASAAGFTIPASASGAMKSFATNAKAATGSVRQLALQTRAAGDSGALMNKQFALTSLGYMATRLGKDLLGISVSAFKVSADYQAAFANVQRTTQTSGKAADDLKKSLIELSTEVPHTFEDIADVAALGGQLGVASSGIVDFTRVVTKLKLTTDLTYDAAGTAIGRISQLLDVPDTQFENLASSILKVGINSVATESQIVKTANNLASIGNLAGLTAPTIIGLSGAIASLGIPPELARGTFEQLFSKISTAATGGGDMLEKFAAISQTSAKDFSSAWNEGGSQGQAILVKFFEGLNKQGKGARDALGDLGIKSVRYVPTLLKLAQNTDVLTKALSDSRSGYIQNTELSKQYAVRTQTVSAKLIELGNIVKSALNNIGSNSLGPLTAVLDVVSKIVKAFGDFANTGVGGTILAIVAGLAALAGAALVGIGTLGTLAGSLLAINVALDAFGFSSGAAAIGVGRLGAVELEATASAAGMTAATAALAAGLSAEAAAAEYAAASTAVYNTQVGRGAAGKAATLFARMGGAARTAGGALAAFAVSTAGILTGVAAVGLGLSAIGAHFKSVREDAEVAATGLDTFQKAFEKAAKAGDAARAGNILGKAGTTAAQIIDNKPAQFQKNQQAQGQNSAAGTSFNSAGAADFLNDAQYKASAAAIKTIDTDLSKLVKSGGIAQASKAFDKIKASASGATVEFPKYKQAVADYNAALLVADGSTSKASLSTDGAVQSYNEMVKAATAAANAIIGYSNAANGSADASSAYYEALDKVKASATDVGAANLNAAGGFALTTEAGRTASAALRDLAAKGNAAAGQLLNAGASSEQVTAQVSRTRASVTEMGKAFGLSGQALKDFVNTYVESPTDLEYNLQVSGIAAAEAALNNAARSRTATINVITTNTAHTNSRTGAADGPGFALGGYTGDGPRSQVAGIVHAGEVVFEQQAVQKIGLSNLMALRNNGAMPQAQTRSTVAAASKSSSRGYTVLDPAQVNQIIQGLSVVVQIGNDKVARAANAANLNTAQRGANG